MKCIVGETGASCYNFCINDPISIRTKDITIFVLNTTQHLIFTYPEDRVDFYSKLVLALTHYTHEVRCNNLPRCWGKLLHAFYLL